MELPCEDGAFTCASRYAKLATDSCTLHAKAAWASWEQKATQTGLLKPRSSLGTEVSKALIWHAYSGQGFIAILFYIVDSHIKAINTLLFSSPLIGAESQLSLEGT